LLSFFTHALPAAQVPATATHRHVGFLNANRRVLALGAIAASCLLTSIPSLPATAEVVHEEALQAVELQNFTAPAVVPSPVVRDGFGITEFSLVQWPVGAGAPISSEYGYRSCAGCTSNHEGIDFTPGSGYPVQAIADGVVTEAAYAADYGVHVIIQHVIDGQTVNSHYAHLQDGSMSLSVGDTVSRGQQIGAVGDTGLSTGPHLHFEILVGDTPIEPHSWLNSHVNS
jgi:murein DD-endopeptidase MepM/ murein hydrolase activator NlpD